MDDYGLRIDFCNYFNCSTTLRLQDQAEVAAGSQILGSVVTRSPTGPLSLGYVESNATGEYRIVYRPDYASTEVIIIDSWQAETGRATSPLFVRFDSSNRTIIGYQKFEDDSLSFVIKRYNGSEFIEQVAEWALDNVVDEITHSPKEQASDTAYVALSGSTVYSFVYKSFVPVPESPESGPTSPSAGNETSPSNASTPASPSSPESIPSDSPSTDPIEPISSTTPDEIVTPLSETPSNISSPNSNETIIPGSPPSAPTTASPPSLAEIGWTNTALKRLMGPTSRAAISTRFGYQVSMDFYDPYGPVFAITYYTPSGNMGTLRGYCDRSGCGTDPNLTIVRDRPDSFNPSSPTAASFQHPPAIATSFGTWTRPYDFTEWRVLTLFPDGVFSLVTYIQPWATSYNTQAAFTLPGPNSPNNPSPNSPNYRSYDLLGVIGLIHAVVGTAAIIIAITLFWLRFQLARANPPVAAAGNSNIDTNSEHQVRTLNMYYTSLKED